MRAMTKPRYLGSGLMGALLAAILVAPAQAHMAAEQEAWLEAWSHRAVEQGHLSLNLIEERWDFLERHHQPAPSASSRSSGVFRGMGQNVEQWRPLVAAYFPASQVDRALCIMGYESGGNPNAYNSSSGASGLMQVLKSWAPKFGYTAADLFVPSVNLSISVALYADGGWGHWSPYKRGLCH